MFKKFILTLSLMFSFCSLSGGITHIDDVDTTNQEVETWVSLFSKSLNGNDSPDHYMHVIETVSNDGSVIGLSDGRVFDIGWWYRSVPKRWRKGDRIYLTFDLSYFKYKFEHGETRDVAWGTFQNFLVKPPTIKSVSLSKDPKAPFKITLSNNLVFKSVEGSTLEYSSWQANDIIIIHANPSGICQLWNINKKKILNFEWENIKKPSEAPQLVVDGILTLEDRLNQKILQQPNATKAVARSLLINSAGLKDKEQPIGVFLFLGPTGVGKTELSKTLAKEVYKNSSSLLRLDMSHFSEQHSVTRLIGSPPGYVNHDDGGQLTEPLKVNPNMIVLLDEIEKAHSHVHKVFLPIFDEGFVHDADNERIECSNVIFIMTSNLCGPEIAELSRRGYSNDKILEIIEPHLMKVLSPELYNRVEPIIFQPLERESMAGLVDLALEKLVNRLWSEKEASLFIDNSLKEFLIENGYHPLLGARPLNKLIEKRVISSLAYNIVSNGIEKGSSITLYYDKESNTIFSK